MKEFIGKLYIEMNARFFQRRIFDEGFSTIEIIEFNKEYHPVGLPSGAQYLTYVKWEYIGLTLDYPNPTVIFTYKYIDSGNVEQTVTQENLYTDYLTVWYPFVRDFFGDEINVLCRVQITDQTPDDSVAIMVYNNLININFITENAIFLYTMNSSKNTVDKSLTFVGNMYIKYNKPISYEQLTVDLELTTKGLEFNYVYLTVLNRYYYITDCVMMKNFYSITLNEDVLMSWKNVIKEQTAYIERQQNQYNPAKVDDLVFFNYKKKITSTTITPSNDIYGNTDTSAYGGGWMFITVVGGN